MWKSGLILEGKTQELTAGAEANVRRKHKIFKTSFRFDSYFPFGWRKLLTKFTQHTKHNYSIFSWSGSARCVAMAKLFWLFSALSQTKWDRTWIKWKIKILCRLFSLRLAHFPLVSSLALSHLHLLPSKMKRRDFIVISRPLQLFFVAINVKIGARISFSLLHGKLVVRTARAIARKKWD